jgi:hypothetical protein
VYFYTTQILTFSLLITSCFIIGPCRDGDVRIAGDGLFYGRFEVCISGVWGVVCSDMFWDNTAAGVACKELGFSQYGMLSKPFDVISMLQT